METRKIRTRKTKNLVKVDMAIIVICICIYLLKLIIGNFFYISVLIYQTIFKINFIFGMLLLVYEILASSFWIWIIYIPTRIALKKKINKNIRYEVIKDIEYYRDKFPNLSPAEISIIADLEVETNKDISATILKLYGKKYIDFENEKIVVKNNDLTGLNKSEQEILVQLSDNKLDMLERVRWKETAIQEAIEHGYIRINNYLNEKRHFRISTILIYFLICCIVVSIISIAKPLIQDMDKIDQEVEQFEKDNKETIENLTNINDKKDYEALYNYLNYFLSGELGKYIIGMFWIVTEISLIIVLIVYKVFRNITYRSIEQNKYIRTQKGKRLAEEIAAMQRFIHEFSLLSEREKKDIELWEDFLVYAVVLEENRNIVKEILAYNNIDLFKFNNIFKSDT